MIRSALLALALASSSPALAAPSGAALPPGVDASGLTAPQREVLARVLDEAYCHCGCPHTLSGCLKEHKACKHGPRMAQLAVKLAGTGADAKQAQEFLTGYYAGFDKKKRATFNVKDFGPPLGNPDAPVTIVEYSDFTCPFCALMRQPLERWVKKNASRVKLVYKPFPIVSHPRAMEAAEAAEFAREKGKFWPMHDLLFENHKALSDGDLAGYAQRLGLPADELAQALASKRMRPRIFGAQAEARVAGLRGTPSLWMNGRRVDILFGTPADPFAGLDFVLDFMLADEEEWVKSGGWARD